MPTHALALSPGRRPRSRLPGLSRLDFGVNNRIGLGVSFSVVIGLGRLEVPGEFDDVGRIELGGSIAEWVPD
jgi:hypothetical protein